MIEFAASIGAGYIATGHYANIEFDKLYNSVVLKKGKDPKKDQTYMLYRLSGEQLSKVIFPRGNLLKSEVRQKAAEEDLNSKTANRIL